MPGGIDTDAIRRSWPDILAKIFTIRRTTWTFLSEHTQVLDYDGTRLLLGIQTEGLATTFRRGQHAELVRQALSEVLGVEAVVEGIPTAQSARSVSPTTGASRFGGPARGPRLPLPAACIPRLLRPLRPLLPRPLGSPSATSPPVRPATSSVGNASLRHASLLRVVPPQPRATFHADAASEGGGRSGGEHAQYELLVIGR